MTETNCEWPNIEVVLLLNRAIELFWKVDNFISNEEKFGSFLSNYNSKKFGLFIIIKRKN